MAIDPTLVLIKISYVTLFCFPVFEVLFTVRYVNF
jgi:hypothetical protein